MANDTNVCMFGPVQIVGLSLVDIITIFMGHPVIGRLLWITIASKKTTDILNFNLALFHYFQYCITFFHLICLLVMTGTHQLISRFLLVYVQIGGPMSLSYICLERYVAVIHPTSYPLLKEYRVREVCALAVWLLSVPCASLSVLSQSVLSILVKSVLNQLPSSVMLSMVTIMVACSIMIARALKKSGPGRDEMHPVKKRAFKTVRATSILTMCCYLPVTLIQLFTYKDVFIYECFVIPASIILLSVASVVHPVLYLSTQGKLLAFFKPFYAPCRALM
ncbi:hypothetical protein VZT92_015220 [Zoarces viviparus]|uniref:G-protein coupled receptors family 1 profile domain-containing protein n=1 Tax=Zoarces viviparus TaxID=48416 RepID=A0AAW1EYT1_ZOAVI